MPRGETCRHHTQWSVLDSGTIVKLVSRVVRRVIHLIPLAVEARPRPGQHEIGMQQVETHSYYSARVRQLLQEAVGRGEAASQVERDFVKLHSARGNPYQDLLFVESPY